MTSSTVQSLTAPATQVTSSDDTLTVELADGRKAAWDDWNTDPADMQRLMKFANENI